jgi:hypothetical protein
MNSISSGVSMCSCRKAGVSLSSSGGGAGCRPRCLLPLPGIGAVAGDSSNDDDADGDDSGDDDDDNHSAAAAAAGGGVAGVLANASAVLVPPSLGGGGPDARPGEGGSRSPKSSIGTTGPSRRSEMMVAS